MGRSTMRFLVPGAVTMIVCTTLFPARSTTSSAADRAKTAAAQPANDEALPKIDSDRAFGYLKKICEFGPRISGSQAMEKQQQLIAEHFTKLKAQVRFQSFDAPHPQSRKPVRMNNIIVSWDPAAKERVLLACHYDTRPLADRDPNPELIREGTFLGANDGASGVALLMELGHHLREIKSTYGVDLIFFDGEELVYNNIRDPFFLGSEYFSKENRDTPPKYKYVCGVLVDMIGGKRLQLHQEINSLEYAPEVTQSVWKMAKKLNVKEFVARPKHEVSDDHVSLNEIAGIPTCDIIDFDYPHWHTTRDVPASCSGESLAKVGRVLLAWLEEVPAPTKKPEKKRRTR
jgi:hypothetical protein